MISRRFVLFVMCVLGSSAHGQDPKTELLPKLPDDRRDQTHLRRVTERVYVHDLAGIAYTTPEKWEEIPPHRLARKIDQRISTVLSIRRKEGDVSASLYWIPLNPGQSLSEFATDTAVAGEFGEEFETLKAVYGKDRVAPPVKFKAGEVDGFRINISGGPEKAEKYDGVLFVGSVQTAGTTWMLKARISYPKGDRIANEQNVLDVLRGYSRIPVKAGTDSK